MRKSAAAPATGTKNAVESFSVSMRVQMATHWKLREIKMDGRIRLFGCGSWNGYYGSDVRIDSTDLKDIHQPDELFIDPRYESRW